MKQRTQTVREDTIKNIEDCISKKTNRTWPKKPGNINITKALLIYSIILFQLVLTFLPGDVRIRAASDDVYLTIKDMPSTLYKGEVFEVTLNLKNESGKKVTDVEFTVVKKEGLTPINANLNGEYLYSGVNLSNNDDDNYTIELTYSGSEDAPLIVIAYRYKLDNGAWELSKSESKILFFKDSSSDYTPPTNTSKFAPNIKIKSNIKMPEFDAGEDVLLTFPIVNDSLYEGKDIEVAIDTENESSLPFTFDRIMLTNHIEKLAPKKDNKLEEETISYNIKIKADTKEGVYPIRLNYRYSNIYGDMYTTRELVYIKIKNNKVLPRVFVQDIQTYSNDPSPGKSMSLTLILKNLGTLQAKDIKVTLKGLSSDGVTTYKSVDSKFISEIAGGEKNKVEYMLVISEKPTNSDISLQADIEYKDEWGNAYSEMNQFFIKINKSEEVEEKQEEMPEIILKDLEFPAEKIKAGDDFDLKFALGNIKAGEARNIKVSLACEEGVLPKSSSIVQIDSLEKDQFKELQFELFTTENAITKNHLITINVEYEYFKNNESNKESKVEKFSLSKYAGVYIEKEKEEEDSDDDKQNTVPKIIINMYSFEPEDIKAGNNFKLKLSFFNTSKIASIRNIKVTFSAKEGVFIPTSSSNTFFIESMDIQGTAEREVELLAKADTAPKSHILNINFEYEDEKGNQISTAEEISIPIKQEQRLVVGQLNLPPEGFEGQPIPIFVDYFNMGKSVLYNLMVSLEGEAFQSENPNYFAGNFEPGRSDYFESMITPNIAGEAVGELVFSFEDETGSKTEIRKEIKLNIMGIERPPMPPNDFIDSEFPGGMNPPEQQNKLLNPLNIGLASGAFIIIIVALIVVIRKRRIRKAGMSFDE